MNFRNKYLVNTVRIVFGVFMIFSGVSGLFAIENMQNIPEPMRAMTQTLVDSGIFHMIKITEIIAGLMLVLNYLVALALIFLAPIAIGIIVVNSMTAPAYVISGVIVSALTAYLAWVHWEKYKPLFEQK